MSITVGDLVSSSSEALFSGAGKVMTVDRERGVVELGFFRSPLEPYADITEIPITSIKRVRLYDEKLVYCRNPRTGYWQRARYGGGRPNDEHLVIFRSGDQIVVRIEEIYIPCASNGKSSDPVAYLKARCTDSPHFSEWRIPFIQSFVEQRADCRSIGSIPSSSIQLEKHQLAVVRRILRDEKRRYLLADEVGLGKTIEAALVLREQLFCGGLNTKAVVGVPESLVSQWREELGERFHLTAMIDKNLFVCAHEDLATLVSEQLPETLIIDEVHQLSPWAWSQNPALRKRYDLVAKSAHNAETCLILSGTPVVGNEKNFLAMLHLLSPNEYRLDEQGIDDFRTRIIERERLGGIYQAFVPENDNGTLEDLVGQLESMFGQDKNLMEFASAVRPHVEFLASPEGENRSKAIRLLRKYIGENFRLHQRMLRNRRDDPAVADLFPGLAGAIIVSYHPGDEPYCLEQYLEEFRGLQEFEQWPSRLICRDKYEQLISAAFVSPSTLLGLLEKIRGEATGDLDEADERLLKTIRDLAVDEQTAKDRALIEACQAVWADTPKARIVVFCSAAGIADHVFKVLTGALEYEVERHESATAPRFAKDESVAVLVCDQAGEDGLNLNGGRKVALHYSLPTKIPRIEQRLGRLNRYSAAIFAAPIKSVVLVPRHGLYSQAWVSLLNQAIRIFSRSVASLQYVLEEKMETMWTQVVAEGPLAISKTRDQLQGDDGGINSEFQRVKVQEDLNRLDEDIAIAAEFAVQLERSDERAEENADLMMNWITQALMFERKPGDFPGTFRFCYNTGAHTSHRTLMDVGSFLTYCYPALEQHQLDPSNPVTVQMSASRDVAAHGRKVHPMRYGSPFIDLIHRFMAEDPRGISTAILRCVSNHIFEEPTPFLGVTFLASLANQSAPREIIRQADEEFAPRLFTLWVDSNGSEVNGDHVLNLLESPYQKKPSPHGYQDINIRSERWADFEEYFPWRLWPQLIETMTGDIESAAKARFADAGVRVNGSLSIERLAAKFIVLIGRS